MCMSAHVALIFHCSLMVTCSRHHLRVKHNIESHRQLDLLAKPLLLPVTEEVTEEKPDEEDEAQPSKVPKLQGTPKPKPKPKPKKEASEEDKGKGKA